MPDKPHPKWKQERCQGCAAGYPLIRMQHPKWNEDLGIYEGHPCTAPTPEQYIAELEAKLADHPDTKRLDYLIDNYPCEPPFSRKLIDSAMSQAAKEADRG